MSFTSTGIRKRNLDTDRLQSILNADEQGFIQRMKPFNAESAARGLVDTGQSGGNQPNDSADIFTTAGKAINGAIGYVQNVIEVTVDDTIDFFRDNVVDPFASYFKLENSGVGAIIDIFKGGDFPGQILKLQGDDTDTVTINNANSPGNTTSNIILPGTDATMTLGIEQLTEFIFDPLKTINGFVGAWRLTSEDTVSGGGGSQTPWTSNIDAADFNLFGLGDLTWTDGDSIVTTATEFILNNPSGTTLKFRNADIDKMIIDADQVKIEGTTEFDLTNNNIVNVKDLRFLNTGAITAGIAMINANAGGDLIYSVEDTDTHVWFINEVNRMELLQDTDNILLRINSSVNGAEPHLILNNDDDSPATNQSVGFIDFRARDDAASDRRYADIICQIEDPAAASIDSSLKINIAEGQVGNTLTSWITMNDANDGVTKFKKNLFMDTLTNIELVGNKIYMDENDVETIFQGSDTEFNFDIAGTQHFSISATSVAVSGSATSFVVPEFLIMEATTATGVADGVMWHDSGTGDILCRTGGFERNLTDIGTGSGSQTPWLTDIDADNFDLFDIKFVIGIDTGVGSFQIIFDGAEDSDSSFFDSGTTDRINVQSGGTNSWWWTPTQTVSNVDLFQNTGNIDVNAGFLLNAGIMQSADASVADNGTIRLGNAQSIQWRNTADTGNATMAYDAFDDFVFNFNALTGNANVLWNAIDEVIFRIRSDNNVVGEGTGFIIFEGDNVTPINHEYGRIVNVIRTTTSGAEAGSLQLGVHESGANVTYIELRGDNAEVDMFRPLLMNTQNISECTSVGIDTGVRLDFDGGGVEYLAASGDTHSWFIAGNPELTLNSTSLDLEGNKIQGCDTYESNADVIVEIFMHTGGMNFAVNTGDVFTFQVAGGSDTTFNGIQWDLNGQIITDTGDIRISGGDHVRAFGLTECMLSVRNESGTTGNAGTIIAPHLIATTFPSTTTLNSSFGNFNGSIGGAQDSNLGGPNDGRFYFNVNGIWFQLFGQRV